MFHVFLGHICTLGVAQENELFIHPTLSLVLVLLMSSGKEWPDAQNHRGLQGRVLTSV